MEDLVIISRSKLEKLEQENQMLKVKLKESNSSMIENDLRKELDTLRNRISSFQKMPFLMRLFYKM